MGREEKRNPFAGKSQVASGLPVVRDTFNRVLVEGDIVQVHTLTPQGYRVEAVIPVVDPSAPPNLMEITLVSVIKFRTARNQRNAEFVRVVTSDEAQEERERLEHQRDPSRVVAPVGDLQ